MVPGHQIWKERNISDSIHRYMYNVILILIKPLPWWPHTKKRKYYADWYFDSTCIQSLIRTRMITHVKHLAIQEGISKLF